MTILLALILLLCPMTARAHEIGTTHVTARLHDGRYDIEVVTDAPSLVDKLDAASGATPLATATADLSANALRERLASGDDLFRKRIAVAFDGASVRPHEVSYSVHKPQDGFSPILATVHLVGDIPRGARQFTWSYGWTFASYALTVRSGADADGLDQWLEGEQTSAPVGLTSPLPRTSRLDTAWRYLVLGFTHIVPHGLDHMLFVLGIFLLSGRVRTVLWQVSAFTLAHSITLGLSMYDLIAVPSSIVEPLIAISIVYVAVENVLLNDLKPWRIALVFAFGLLHGMGFAGALQELGLPRQEFLTALLTFNVGVEAGQLAVIALAFALVGWHNSRDWYRRRVVVPASLAIAGTAVYWTVERLS